MANAGLLRLTLGLEALPGDAFGLQTSMLRLSLLVSLRADPGLEVCRLVGESLIPGCMGEMRRLISHRHTCSLNVFFKISLAMQIVITCTFNINVCISSFMLL